MNRRESVQNFTSLFYFTKTFVGVVAFAATPPPPAPVLAVAVVVTFSLHVSKTVLLFCGRWWRVCCGSGAGCFCFCSCCRIWAVVVGNSTFERFAPASPQAVFCIVFPTPGFDEFDVWNSEGSSLKPKIWYENAKEILSKNIFLFLCRAHCL